MSIDNWVAISSFFWIKEKIKSGSVYHELPSLGSNPLEKTKCGSCFGRSKMVKTEFLGFLIDNVETRQFELGIAFTKILSKSMLFCLIIHRIAINRFCYGRDHVS